jgi:hypothetical protein
MAGLAAGAASAGFAGAPKSVLGVGTWLGASGFDEPKMLDAGVGVDDCPAGFGAKSDEPPKLGCAVLGLGSD